MLSFPGWSGVDCDDDVVVVMVIRLALVMMVIVVDLHGVMMLENLSLILIIMLMITRLSRVLAKA